MKAECMNAWKQARQAQDYGIFRPYLARAFDLKKQIALLINPDAPAFETLVGMTDEGLQVREVSEQFDRRKPVCAVCLIGCKPVTHPRLHPSRTVTPNR